MLSAFKVNAKYVQGSLWIHLIQQLAHLSSALFFNFEQELTCWIVSRRHLIVQSQQWKQ